MKNVLKKFSVVLMTIITLFSLMLFPACSGIGGKEDHSLEKITTFYETVVDSQKRLDTVADDIYSRRIFRWR